jgi:6-phosphogluconolactonase
MTPTIHEAPIMASLAESLAERIAAEIGSVIADCGHCTLALAGGKTPAPLCRALSARALEWDDVTVTLSDERYVPPTHKDSNEAMIRESLLVGRAAKARFLPLYVAAESAEASLSRIAPLPRIDIAVVGMGEDMHTLSWFPGANGLLEAMSTTLGRRLAVVRPGILTPRITLTAGALGEARFIHLLIAGEAKRAALEKALATPSALEAPVKRLFEYRLPRVEVWYTPGA